MAGVNNPGQGGLVSARAPQGPTRQQAAQFTAMEMGAQPLSLQRVVRGGFDGRIDDDKGNFPTQLYPDMKLEDTRMMAKKEVVQGGNNFTGQPATQINYSIGDEDIRYYEAKKEAEELASYERWINTQFNFKSPADVERFSKMFPDYFERRMNVLKNISDANLRYAQICMTGAQSSDDYLYLWLVQTGKIPLIDGPIWDPSRWFSGTQETSKMALFNPLRLVASGDVDMVPPPGPSGPDANWVYPGIPDSTPGGALAFLQGFIDGKPRLGIPSGTTSVRSFFR